MLNHQINLFLDKKTHQFLISLAKSKNTSMGALIRQAINKVYKKKNKEFLAIPGK